MHTQRMARPQEVVDPRGAVVQRVPRLGDMRWDGEVWRRWNGSRWIKAVYAFRPDRLRNPARFVAEDTVSQERRDKALALAVEDQVVTNGAAVVHEGPTGVVIAFRERPSTTGHVLLTLLTAGLQTRSCWSRSAADTSTGSASRPTATATSGRLRSPAPDPSEPR